MKKIIALTLALIMSLSCFSLTIFAEETKTTEHLTEIPEGYIGVYTIEDLYCIRNDLTANYILMNDIDLTEATAEGGDWNYGGRGWNPIGSQDCYSASPFSGIFDGNGYQIKGLRIDIGSDVPSGTGSLYLGLFSQLSGTIKNLTVEGRITSEMGKNTFAGGIVATGSSSAVIENCKSIVDITCQTDRYVVYAGGMSGYYHGTVKNCINIADIEICSGFVGSRDANSSDAYGYSYASGIVGFLASSGATISKCINTGSVAAVSSGGYMYKTTVGTINTHLARYWYHAMVVASGIASGNQGQVENCYNVADIKASIAEGKDYAGALAGGISYDCTASNCYQSGTSTGYAIGSKTLSNCYYLSETGKESTGAVVLTEAQMKLKSMYSDWDFDTVWTMEGREDYLYPELRDVPLVLPDDSKTAISGTVTVTGEAKVGSTLTAEITDISPDDATFEYLWKADGEVVGTDLSYTLTQNDVGKKITLTVKGNGDFKGEFSSSVIIGECVHSLGEYTNNNDATCEKNETRYAVCEKCGATVTEEIEGTRLSHIFTNYTYNNDATCTADGTKTAKCENCDATDTITDTGSMKAHTPAAAVVENEVAATCTAGGSYDEVVYCTVCSTELSREAKTIDRLGHSFTNYVSNNDATCTADGTKTAKCENCNATDTITDTGSMKAHTPAAAVVENEVAATCTAGGSYDEVVYCTVCSTELSREAKTIDRLGHSFTNYVSNNDATCTADGTKTAKCDRCDVTDTITAENTMLEHVFSDIWTIDKEATCTEEGVKSHHCKNCDATKDETVLNKLAHVYVSEITEATCDKDGKIVYTCSCGDTYSKIISATGHKDNDGDGKCDECFEYVEENNGENKPACKCICHETGIQGLLYKIFSYLQRYFKIDLLGKVFKLGRVCDCGEYHY